MVAVATILASCEKQEVLTENKQESSFQKEYEVINGVLCFKNLNSLEILKKELAGKNYDELASWEDKIGFNSIEKAKSDLLDEIACRADGFVSKGYSQQEVIEKYNNGELEELTDQMRTEIDRLKLMYDKDNDGIRMMKYNILCHYPNRFINEDYKVVIADTLYQFSKEQIEITPGFNSSTKVEPIVVSRQFKKSNLKSTSASSNVMCYDVFNDGDHSLTADLIAERYDNTMPIFKLYIDYHGYYKSWFKWKEGTYNVTWATDYDWSIHTVDGSELVRQESKSGSASSSPIEVQYLGVGFDYEYYDWVAVGNIDNGSVSIGGGITCYWDQDNGCWGNKKQGYCSTYYFYN